MRHSYKYIQLITTLILLSVFLFSQVFSQDPLKKLRFSEENQKSLTIPFQLVNNLIIIQLRINDSGDLNFILDTGLTTTLLTELAPNDSLSLLYARELELQGLGQGEPLSAMHSYGNELLIQDIIGKNQDIYVVFDNIFNLSARLGMPINGILGYSIFSSFIVRINYSNNKISLYDPDSFEYRRKHRNYREVPLIMHETKPYILMKITDHEGKTFDVKVLLDTGASHALWIDPHTLDGFTIPEKTHPAFLGFGLNGEVYGELSRIRSLELAGFSFENPVVSFPDSASTVFAAGLDYRNGSIGSELLKRFNLIIDYPNNKLWLQPNLNYKDKFKQNMSGIELIAPIHNLPIFLVESVRKGSPAWNAGVRVGDEVSSINGIPAIKMKLDDIYHIFQSKPNKKVNIRFFREGKPVQISFRLEEFI